MRVILSIILLALCGCATQRSAPESSAQMWRANDRRFSSREREIIAAARRFMEKYYHKVSGDRYYYIERTKDGYEVFVEIAGGYEHGRALFFPGGSCTVLLREDLSLIRVVLGA